MRAGTEDHHKRVLLLRRFGAAGRHVGRLLGVQRRRAARLADMARVPLAAERHQTDVQRARFHVADAVVRAHRGAGPVARAPHAGDRVRGHQDGALARVRQPVPVTGPGARPQQHRPLVARVNRAHGRPARGHAGRQLRRRHQQRRVRPVARAPQTLHGPQQHQLRRGGRVRTAAQTGGTGRVREPFVRLAVPVRVPRAGRAPPAGHARQPPGPHRAGRVRRAGQPGGIGVGGQRDQDGGRPGIRRAGGRAADRVGREPADRARRPHVPRPRQTQIRRHTVQRSEDARVRRRRTHLRPATERDVLLILTRSVFFCYFFFQTKFRALLFVFLFFAHPV